MPAIILAIFSLLSSSFNFVGNTTPQNILSFFNTLRVELSSPGGYLV
jgi:hypothetical protein